MLIQFYQKLLVIVIVKNDSSVRDILPKIISNSNSN